MMVIEYLKIGKFFDYIVTADSVKNPKPAPDMLLKILEYFKILPENAFYAGDMDIDLKTGIKAGIDTYIVLTGSSTEKEILKVSKNVRIFSDLIELKKFLISSVFIHAVD